MKVCRVTRAAVAHISANMRAEDRAEILCLTPRRDLVTEVREKVETPGAVLFCFHADDNEPVMLCGFLPGPALWITNTFLVATPRIVDIGIQAAKAGRKMHGAMVKQGVRRFQTAVLLRDGSMHEQRAIRFLLFLGYTPEGTLRNFGPEGQDFMGFARIHR